MLANISLRAEVGEALLLTGPNGVGKTTLIRAIAGLLALSEGTIELEGAADVEARVGEQSHYVGHLNGVRPALTVSENVRFWAQYLGASEKNVEAALDHFRLGDLASIRAGFLSAGQKRRLGLCRLLVAQRPVWLLDEPAVSLDAASRELLSNAVNDHLATGGIVVAATHQPLGFSPARELALGVGGRSVAEQPVISA